MVAFCSLKIERGIGPNVKNDNGKNEYNYRYLYMKIGPHSNPKIFS